MQPTNKEAALAGTASYSGNDIADSNVTSNSKNRFAPQLSACDLIAAVRRSRSDSALADAMRAAIARGRR